MRKTRWMGSSLRSEIEEANRKAVERVLEADAMLVDVGPAIKTIPAYRANLITHAGPPIEWGRMCKTQKMAIVNLAIYEGLADTPEKADAAIRRGEILLEHNHKYGNVSGMCGITSASMPVLVVRNPVHGNVAFDWQQTDMTSFGQGYEKGQKELDFVINTLAPLLAAAVKLAKGINV